MSYNCLTTVFIQSLALSAAALLGWLVGTASSITFVLFPSLGLSSSTVSFTD